MGSRSGVWGVAVLALLACCAFTDCDPNGCSALDSADECNAGSLRCADSSHLQGCETTQCSATWDTPQKCGADKPFCVQVKKSTAYPNAAECASAPSCSATSACTGYGLCADAADGKSCVAAPDAGAAGAPG